MVSTILVGVMDIEDLYGVKVSASSIAIYLWQIKKLDNGWKFVCPIVVSWSVDW